jgi:hypothetical protein
MALSKDISSHEHSLKTLNLLYEYDTFMDSIKVVVDMGCGAGLDSEWWATLWTRDDPPEPHNYTVYAIDNKIKQIDPELLEQNENIHPIEVDIESKRVIPRQADMIWCHDVFQNTINPIQTLSYWNEIMNKNGMLVLTLPQHQSYQYNRLQTRSYSGCYYQHNICSLMYMLAVNGFDCRDAYFDMKPNSSWISAAVYKDRKPMDPKTTTWFDLADMNLVNDSVKHSLNKYGYVAQEELLFTWLDKDWRYAKN